MRDKKLEQLKREYVNIPIPKELDFLVQKTLRENGVQQMKRKNKFLKAGLSAAVSAAAAVAILTIGVNSSAALAKTLADVPIVGGIVKVLTFTDYSVKDDTFEADLKAPVIEGLENKNLQSSLNEKYLDENKKLYEHFMAEMQDMKEKGGGHLGVDSGYVVKTDTDNILSIGRYVVNMVGSSSTTFQYDTIDKKDEILITLPSLFKDESYTGVISSNIKEQMIAQHKADENMIYCVEGIAEEGTDLFERISKDQSFYINSENKLVISFDKYEVAPGYMGVVEFVIPTEAIADLLAGNAYIN